MDGRPTWKQALVIAALACTPPLTAARTGGDCGPRLVGEPAGLAAPAATEWSAAPRSGHSAY